MTSLTASRSPSPRCAVDVPAGPRANFVRFCGEMPPIVEPVVVVFGRTRAARAGAEFERRRCGDLLRGGRWGGLKGDGEAELFELGDETACSPFRILSFGEVVLAHVLVHLAGAEQMPDQLDQRVRDGDGRLVRSAAASDLPVLRAEVAVLGACRGPAGLEQRAAQPLVAAGGADRRRLPADS